MLVAHEHFDHAVLGDEGADVPHAQRVVHRVRQNVRAAVRERKPRHRVVVAPHLLHYLGNGLKSFSSRVLYSPSFNMLHIQRAEKVSTYRTMIYKSQGILKPEECKHLERRTVNTIGKKSFQVFFGKSGDSHFVLSHFSVDFF